MINYNKDEFRDHRKYWKTKDHMRLLFGNKVNMDSAPVQNLIRAIDSIPESRTYTIAAYGSLLNTKDVYRTMPSASNFRKGLIHGYERIFNMGSLGRGCVLNIRPCHQDVKLTCNFIDIDYTDLPEYILREGWYDVIVVDRDEYTDSGNNEKVPVLTVIGDKSIVNNSIGVEPQLNYLHLCLDGMKDVAGWEGVKEFLDKTICYNNKANEYTPVRQWLYSLDLQRYFVTNDYSSR